MTTLEKLTGEIRARAQTSGTQDTNLFLLCRKIGQAAMNSMHPSWWERDFIPATPDEEWMKFCRRFLLAYCNAEGNQTEESDAYFDAVCDELTTRITKEQSCA